MLVLSIRWVMATTIPTTAAFSPARKASACGMAAEPDVDPGQRQDRDRPGRDEGGVRRQRAADAVEPEPDAGQRIGGGAARQDLGDGGGVAELALGEPGLARHRHGPDGGEDAEPSAEANRAQGERRGDQLQEGRARARRWGVCGHPVAFLPRPRRAGGYSMRSRCRIS
jgi:hypothetical protein